jgi:hypothetical protein
LGEVTSYIFDYVKERLADRGATLEIGFWSLQRVVCEKGLGVGARLARPPRIKSRALASPIRDRGRPYVRCPLGLAEHIFLAKTEARVIAFLSAGSAVWRRK